MLNIQNYHKRFTKYYYQKNKILDSNSSCQQYYKS